MRRLAIAILLSALACAAQTAPPQPDSQGGAQARSTPAESRIVVPAGTTVSLMLTSPILAKTAKAGDSVYAQAVFPVAVNNQMAIPPGTYVQGQIDTLTRPGWLSPHAQLQIHFTKIIFANGYTVELAGPQNVTTGQPPAQPASAASGTPLAPADDVIAAVATAYVQVSSASDVLLDNGSQVEMVLQVPLRLNAASVAAAVRLSNPALLAHLKSATLCRPIPGTPGTPDTVIPGTPGTPGTPPTVIPGGPGMPDTVIPGTPATPGTPDTIMPGTPGTPGVRCPSPPVVTSNLKVQSFKESFQINAPVQVSGMQLSAGSYQVTWEGSGPLAQVDILQNGNIVVRVRARVVLLNRKSPADAPGTRTNSDGSVFLQSLRFAGQTFALYFDQGEA
ncbi:MAG: hypothetical protein ABSH01_05660 [Terriglobia bacterium]